MQVSKDEYGEKVVKPWVNLHVTPNHQLIDKFGYLVHKLKTPPYYDHPPAHYYQHNHFYNPSIQSYPLHSMKPFYPVTVRPSYYSPHYAPSYHGYNTLDYTPVGYDEEYDDYDSSYYRSANVSNDVSSNHNKRTSYPESESKSSPIVFPNDRSFTTKRNRREAQVYNEEGGILNQVNGKDDSLAIFCVY